MCHRLSSRVDASGICAEIQGNGRFSGLVYCFHLAFRPFCFFVLLEGREKPFIEIIDNREVGGTHQFVKSKTAAIGYWADSTFCCIDAGEWKRGVSRLCRPRVKAEAAIAAILEETARLNLKRKQKFSEFLGRIGRSTCSTHESYRTESCFWPNCLCSSRINSLVMRSSLSSAELTRYIPKTENCNDRNQIADQRCSLKTMVFCGCSFLHAQKNWFCPLLFNDFRYIRGQFHPAGELWQS